MKVILQRDVPKLGKDGEIVSVADGYGRNYLFPRNYAVPATGSHLKAHQNSLSLDAKRSAGKLDSAQKDADKLSGASLTILARAGSGTRLFGSITASDVADAVLKQLGVTVDKRRVGLIDPIKTMGEYAIGIRLHSDVSVNVNVTVTTAEEIARKKAAAELAATRAAAEAARIAAAEAAAAPAAEAAPAPVSED